MTTPLVSALSHSTGHFTAQPALMPAQLASNRLSAGQFAAVEGKKGDFRSDPEPSGLTRSEVRQIVLDILG